LNTNEQENVIDLKNDLLHDITFGQQELSQLCISKKNDFLELSSIAIKYLSLIESSYLCETGFSVLIEIK